MSGDLSITALYTSATWAWAEFPAADLYRTDDADRVFRITNAVMWMAGWFIRGPSLKHSLIQRHAMIDHLTRGHRRFLELAAGLSRRGADFSKDPSVQYVEVDLPHVIAHKESLLRRSQRGLAVAARFNLRRLSADVTELDLLDWIDSETAVVAEGLLMYFPAEDQRSLFHRIAGCSPARFVFDLTPAPEQPKAGMIGRMLGWMMRKFTGGRGFIEDQRGRDAIRSELLEAGFQSVNIHEPQSLGSALPFPREKTQVVIFECLMEVT